MRQDSAFSISNCNAPGCSNPYNHLSVSSIRPPSILLRYRNTPSSTPQRNSPSVHCPNNSPFATCFEPWNVGQAIPYTRRNLAAQLIASHRLKPNRFQHINPVNHPANRRLPMHRRQNPARRRRRDDIIRHPLHLHLRTGKTGIIAPNV